MQSTPTSIARVAVVAALIVFSAGCVGRTGKIGKPIAATYESQIGKLNVGESGPEDLKSAFSGSSVSLRETKIQNGVAVETWEVFRGGNMDAGAFLLWGQIAHDKDQSLLFHFANGRLTSYETIVHEDSPAK